ncbi:MAG: DNA repair protein RecO [Pseudomonadota bacterium]
MSQRARVLLQPGYVLHRRPYRDSSLLLDVFTPEFGRVGLVARGARQVKSRSQALLQSFNPLLVSWSGSGELANLNAVESAAAAHWLTGPALMSGLYLNELLARLLHRFDPHSELYASYETALAALVRATADSTSVALEPVLRIFEKRLMAELGYGLVLDHEADTGLPVEAGRVYAYHLGEGPVRWPDESAAPAETLLIRGASLLDLAREDLADAGSLREAKRLMRVALAAQLGNKPLASRRLFTRHVQREPL